MHHSNLHIVTVIGGEVPAHSDSNRTIQNLELRPETDNFSVIFSSQTSKIRRNT